MAVNTKDKYFTPDWLVEHTIKKAIEIIGKDNITDIVEPSAGDGAFIRALKNAFPDTPQRYYDLYPEHPEVVRYDYKKLKLSCKKGRMTIGNPPFGTSSSLWKAFCKKAATNSDYIVFISPASQYNSNYYFKEGDLIYSELLNDVEYRGSEVEGGKNQKVRTCLNIYKVYDREEEEDWREEKIKSQLKFGRRFKDGDGYDNLYDYYLANMTSGLRFGTLCGEDEYYATFGVSVLDERIRNKIHYILENELWKELHKMRESNSCGTFFINNTNFVECMKKLLYPTREELLEQDVLITRGMNKRDDWDLYVGRWGLKNAGRITDNLKQEPYCVKILNENRRKDIEDFFKTFRDKIDENEPMDQTGTGPTINGKTIKDALMNYLYPQDDPQFEDYDYPEVRKPVHVERAHHAKPLIEPTYIPEFVKEPSTSTTLIHKPLF